MRGVRFTVFLAAVVATAADSRLAVAGLMIPVNANVNGMNMRVGTIDANSGPANDTDHLTARFDFAMNKGFLDAWYDFRWVNVVTAVPGMPSPLFPNGAPAIDPQSPPTNPAEDNEPFYYHTVNEWNPGMFGTEVIRQEGVFSLFSDSPERAMGNGFDFSTYLVVRNLTDPGFGMMDVVVLAGFNWTYRGTGDVSTVGMAINVGAADVMLINRAMGNAAPANGFAGWTAIGPAQNLSACPTPAPPTLVVFVAVGVIGLGWSRLRLRRAA